MSIKLQAFHSSDSSLKLIGAGIGACTATYTLGDRYSWCDVAFVINILLNTTQGIAPCFCI